MLLVISGRTVSSFCTVVEQVRGLTQAAPPSCVMQHNQGPLTRFAMVSSGIPCYVDRQGLERLQL